MPDDLRIFPDDFVPNVQASDAYKRWAKSSPGDRARWEAFRNALLANPATAVVPVMSTRFGRALAAAGREHMSISALVGLPVPPYPPPGSPPTPPSVPSYPSAGPLTISSGGTYSGYNWTSTGSTPAIRVETAQAVTISYAAVTNLAGGPLIQCAYGVGANLTVDHVFGYGGTTYQTSGRFIEAESNVDSFTVTNCTIENTQGIMIATSPGVTISILRNRHRNVKGGPHTSPLGNFLQMRVFVPSSCEIAWNEVVNEYDLSEPEDIISIYHVSGAHLHDNMLWHHSRIGNLTPSSQGGITVDGSDAGPGVSNNLVENNQVVDGYGILVWPGVGSGNMLLNNRLIGDRLLPNGQNKANGAGAPLGVIGAGGGNNHAHGNVVGYIDKDGTYITAAILAGNLAGAPEGGTAEAALNTIVPQSEINAAAEAAEWALWQQKLATNGITIGA